MNEPGVVVWGLGRHALKRIIPAISSIDNLSLVGVCSRNEESVFECAQRWNCIGWTDHTEMLENDIVDIVYIATPIGLHTKFTTLALKSGKHVWCEKPLTCDYEDSQHLVELSKHGDQMLAECFMYLHHPQFSRIGEFAKGDEGGPVRFVNCRFGIPFLENPGFRYDPELCGGAFWDVASYTSSAILELFPKQEIKVVYSEFFKKENSPVDFEGRALLTLSNGVKAYLDWGIGLGYKNEIDLWAEYGSLYTDKIFSKPDDYQPVFHLRDKKGNQSIEYGDITDQFVVMLCNFRSMLYDSKKITDERNRILLRAKLMDEIFQFSEKHS